MALIPVVILTTPCPAADQDREPDFSSMSLHDLLNVEITTASRKSEKIFDAPAVMTLISEREIRELGGSNLVEILDRTTSVYFMGTQENLQGLLTLRGDATQAVNNHILVLIDGRPIQESTLGGFVDPFYRSFPVESIKQIEVIRGPGSVLYGTNAYVGVVNVITKSWDAGGIARVEVGSFDSRRAVVAGGRKSGDLEVSGGIAYLESDGWNFTATDSEGVTDSIRFYDRKLGANLTARYKGLSFISYYGQAKAPHLSKATASTSWAEESGWFESNQWMADLGYQHRFSDRWTSSLNLTCNQLAYDGVAGTDGPREIRSRTYFLESSNSLSITRDLNAIIGGSVLRRAGSRLNVTENFYGVPHYRTNDYTGFVQLDYRPVSYLKLIAGGQVNKIPQIDAHYVGRLGAVGHFTPQWGAKLLYSEAFRRPSESETGYLRIDDGLVEREGNPDLLPEEIDTTDVQIFYHDQKVSAALTLFYSRQRDLIRELDGFELIQNVGSVRTRGAELEFEGQIGKTVEAIAAITYQESRDANDNRSVMPVPNTIVKLSLTWHSTWGLSAGLHDSYFSAGRPVKDLFPDILEVNPDAEAFHDLSLRVAYKINDVLTAQFYGTNLLDADIYYPEHTSESINTIPGRPGRAVFFGLSVQL